MRKINYGMDQFKLAETRIEELDEYADWLRCRASFVDYHGRHEADTNKMIKEIFKESPEYDTESIFKYIYTIVAKPPEFLHVNFTA